MICSLATKITAETIDAINALEKKLGKTLLAFQCHDLKPSELSDDQVRILKQTEGKLGISLVAVDP